MNYRKKLIEVALPLEAINKEAAREKSIRHGHPSTLHLWWARRPLAACRAVIFASLVDDPSSRPDEFPTEEAQEKERYRLFRIIEQLVKWENSNNTTVLEEAKKEINKCTNDSPPPLLDPFSGGGSIPLEAQRLGLKATASDLNPVAVLINKTLIEIPQKFSGKQAINPEAQNRMGQEADWPGSSGLADDIRYYGNWLRDEAERRVGNLYPKVDLPLEYGGRKTTVIAWLWARTVKCPNPACEGTIPLIRSFWLSTKKKTWLEPIINLDERKITYKINAGKGIPPDGTVSRHGAKCIFCGTSLPFDYIRFQGKEGKISIQLISIVAEGERGRVYIQPLKEHEIIAKQVKANWKPDQELQGKCRVNVSLYGMDNFADLFSERQLFTLATLCDLVDEVHKIIKHDAIKAGMQEDGIHFNYGDSSATDYADAVATYLAFSIDRLVDKSSTLAWWMSAAEKMAPTFSRQALAMVWDYAEMNPFCGVTSNLSASIEWVAKVVNFLPSNVSMGEVEQIDASSINKLPMSLLISTDPPYYDNICYADLSDFFYIWLRKMLGNIYPDLFSTLLVPKTEELVASSFRFGGNKDRARQFFESGLEKVFCRFREIADLSYPITIYYAFKQSDAENNDNSSNVDLASTGWETMLEGLIRAGLAINGTWPMRTERGGGLRNFNQNALASSIVLVCRSRPGDALTISRREFMLSLRNEVKKAIKTLQQGNIAPVDLAQAAIGPGMAIFSSYAQVLEANGEPMSVRTALQMINRELDACLTEQEGEMDGDTRFCITWYEQFGMSEKAFGEADVLARAKNTTVTRLVEGGILSASKGKVKLLKREEISSSWNPETDRNKSIWMCTQQLVRTLISDGEMAAAKLAYQIGNERSEATKSMAYRLYTISERRGWTEEAFSFNTLVISWPSIQEKVVKIASTTTVQSRLFE